jgi:AraC-like DNA-binding protein
MNRTPSIPLYREINECHEATGFPIRSDLPEFHVFTFEETYPCTRQAMPPYRRGFYQVTLLETMAAASMNFENEMLSGAENVLVFSPPEQVLSWICGGSEQGYMLYFKSELLSGHGRTMEEMFPFFDINAVSVLPIASEDLTRLRTHFDQLRTAGAASHLYRIPQIAALTTAFLYECRALYDRLNVDHPERMGSPALVSRFRELLARCFQHHCSVESYAECLNISADHLRVMVKKHTGKTVRELIDERVMLEARRLLAHTELGVSEVAWHLQFSEPTHFARFFKRHAGCTPLVYKKEAQTRAITAA